MFNLLTVHLGLLLASGACEVERQKTPKTKQGPLDGLQAQIETLSFAALGMSDEDPEVGAYVRAELITPGDPRWSADEARRAGVTILPKGEEPGQEEGGEVVSPTGEEGAEGGKVQTEEGGA